MRRILIIIQFLLNIAILNGQNCDRFFSTTLTYENDFLDLHYNNMPTGNYYKIFHRTNETVNTDLNTIDIKEPIIIIEGYDIFFTESCDEIYDHYINYAGLGDELRAEGYDIITFNLDYPMAALQPNALIFADFLEFINANKTGDEELIVMGVSMGGLIARYALTYMEENEMQHQTKLFISFDSPQKGGYAPLSIQALLSDPIVVMSSIASGDLAYLINCFVSDGTLQMLTHHVREINNGYANPPPHHVKFFNELTTMNDCDGFPENCKRVGISNGSLNGTTQEGLSIWGDYSGNPAIVFHYGRTFSPFSRILRTVPGVDNWALDYGQCIYQGNENCNTQHGYYIEKDGLPLDHVPGGYYPWYKTVYQQLTQINHMQIQYYLNDNANFVSTISALALSTNDMLLNINDYSKEEILGNTQFDDIWWDTSHDNMKHTSYNWNLREFIKTQIHLSETESYAQENLHLTNGVVNSGERKLYKAANKITIDNYIVKAGGELILKAGNSIEMGDGFEAEEGSKFIAKIENIHSRNCNLSNNLPQFSSSNYLKNYTTLLKYDTIIGGYNITLYKPNNQQQEYNLNTFNETNEQNTKFAIYPNPAVNIINISYYLPSEQDVYIKLIEPASGRIVKKIIKSKQEKGYYNILENVSNISEGFYLIIMQTNNSYFSKKFIKY